MLSFPTLKSTYECSETGVCRCAGYLHQRIYYLRDCEGIYGDRLVFGTSSTSYRSSETESSSHPMGLHGI